MKILAIAVHPDDETLGCGGALLKHRAQGDELHWLLLTAATAPAYNEAQIETQRQQIESVKAAYPFAGFHWLKLPTTQLDCIPMSDLVGAIREVVAAVRPEVVYVPNRSDAHSDHRFASQAVQAVLKSFYLRNLGVKRVLACDVLSETDAAAPLPEHVFLPNVTVDVTAHFERKLEIMQLFRSEVHPEPGPRSISAIRAQGRVRGAAIGVEYGEAFMLIREIA